MKKLKLFLAGLLLLNVTSIAAAPQPDSMSGAINEADQPPPTQCPELPPQIDLYTPEQAKKMLDELERKAKDKQQEVCERLKEEGDSEYIEITDLSLSGYWGRVGYAVVGGLCQIIEIYVTKKNARTYCKEGCPTLVDSDVARRFFGVSRYSSPKQSDGSGTPGHLIYSVAHTRREWITTSLGHAATGSCGGLDICKHSRDEGDRKFDGFSSFARIVTDAAARISYQGVIPNPVCEEATYEYRRDDTLDFCHENWGETSRSQSEDIMYNFNFKAPFRVKVDAKTYEKGEEIPFCKDGGTIENTFELDKILLNGFIATGGSMKQPVQGVWVQD